MVCFDDIFIEGAYESIFHKMKIFFYLFFINILFILF